MSVSTYEPFARGPFDVDVRTIAARRCEMWSPAGAGLDGRPLIVYAPGVSRGRRSATYLCEHLASHGYVVAAMDHADAVEVGLPLPEIVARRVPEMRSLIDFLLDGEIAASAVGLVGYSFGGWAVLATPAVDPRIQSIVALSPGGARMPRPGVIRAPLDFDWGHDVPTLFIAAEQDTLIPLEDVRDVYDRTPATKQLTVLPRADHHHFLDSAEAIHETMRRADLPGEAAWIPGAMLPFSDLCSEREAHEFIRGMTVTHLDATLRPTWRGVPGEPKPR